MHSTKVVGEHPSGAGRRRPGWRGEEEEGVGGMRSRSETTLVGKMTSNEQGELILEGTKSNSNCRLVSK